MKTTPNNSKINDLNGLRHQMEYLDFITWIATPNAFRTPKTQQELSKKFGVGQDTLSEWKNRPRFWASVAEKRKQWGQERTPDVVMALYNRIIRTGSAPEVKLWLQYFEDWSEKIISVEPPLRKYANLTNTELAELERTLKNFLLKK
ncbi:MAG: hypothetical protein HYU04_01050 [Candidatus Wildermuthbacteria bacterium]|nr:hypothetical protein [Candidatus Wildermuthbacteria bacterium]